MSTPSATVPTTESVGQPVGQLLKNFFDKNKILVLLCAIVCIWLFFGYKTDWIYLKPRNISNLFRQMAITGLLACGMVFVIIAGEIDLSVGSVLGFLCGMTAVLCMDPIANSNIVLAAKMSPYAVIPIILGLGIIIGCFNGMFVAYFKIPSFIVGLAAMLIFRGGLLGVTDATNIQLLAPEIIYLGQGYISPNAGIILGAVLFLSLVMITFQQRVSRQKYHLPIANIGIDIVKVVVFGAIIAAFVVTMNRYQGIPVPVLILLITLGIFTFIATSTVFGRRIYAVGSNMEATRLSGVNVARVKLMIFGLMGFMSALAGLITVARLSGSTSSAGTSAEMDAIASCFIGGTSMKGGSGTVHGALIGALVMASLDNGMYMLNVQTYWQMIIKGSILLLAVWIDVATKGNHRA